MITTLKLILEVDTKKTVRKNYELAQNNRLILSNKTGMVLNAKTSSSYSALGSKNLTVTDKGFRSGGT
jgi:hypothetical protein